MNMLKDKAFEEMLDDDLQPNTADPDAPDTDAHTTGTEAKA